MAEKIYEKNYKLGIPEEWTANKFRQIFHFRKGLSITKENLTDEGVPVISYGQIHSKLNTGTGLNKNLIRFVPETYLKTDAECLTCFGDIIFADTSEDYDGIGNCALIDSDESIFAGYHTIIARPTDKAVDSKYFAYLFQTDLWRSQIRSRVMGIKVFSVTQKDLRETTVYIPPISEQHAIASYLDRKCGEIDGIIADLQRQIELLQSYKKSLISEVVTKGLDPNAPMKDSGIEWIGKIPEHWICKKLGYVASVTKLAGFEFTNYFDYIDEGEVIAIRGLNLKNFKISTEDIQKIALSVSDKLPRSQIKPMDILVSYAGTVGSIGLLEDFEGRYHLAPNVGKVTVGDDINAKYLAYYLISNVGQEAIDVLKNKNAQESISMENLRRIKILVPSLEEQCQIVEYLNDKCLFVDELIEGKEHQLTSIKNHRKSVIYEYVTGKKRVKEVS